MPPFSALWCAERARHIMEPQMKQVTITVECIGCKARKEIDYAESQRLSLQGDVPLCDKCGMPAVFVSVKTARARRGSK